ncbi:MAG: glycoside hydrolase [Bacteroidota bacterium]
MINNRKKIITSFIIVIIALQSFSQSSEKLVFTIKLDDTVQRIRNIGASGCWYSEEMGATWPEAKKKKIAELLFSRDLDSKGQPKGIGLSAFRYNIGAGTAEQGDSSGIDDPARRVECFLSPDGSYHWNKQKGYTWMLQQAKNYGVENLIAFVNSPPVQFTKNGLGFKLEKDFISNLKEDKYADYANFLTEVINHFDKENLHFNYISPVNEPQWDWSGVYGNAKQEGSPWTNTEIFNTVTALSKSLAQKKVNTKIIMPEAGTLEHLFGSTGKASKQVADFRNPESPLYTGGMNNTTSFIEGHGYFTDYGDEQLITTRSRLRDTLKKYGPGLEYWQSEYCMLGDGYKENTKEKRRSAIDCALFLAKVIHHDFTVGNATAWHYWNSYEPGPSDSNTLYYLISLNRNRMNHDTNDLFTVTKNLWALGHYSLFVRPGMYRVETNRSDNMNDIAAAQQLMISAFRDEKKQRVIVNVINYTNEERKANFVLKGLDKGKSWKLVSHFITSSKEGDDMKPYPVNKKSTDNSLPARSINTFIFLEK